MDCSSNDDEPPGLGDTDTDDYAEKAYIDLKSGKATD
jgi:hypothetical protein